MKIQPIIIIALICTFVMGMYLGSILQQAHFIKGAVKVAEGLEGTNIDLSININETILADRMMELILEDQGR